MFVIPNILYIFLYISLYLLKYTLTISEKIFCKFTQPVFMTVFIPIGCNEFKNMKEIKVRQLLGE